MQRGGVRGHDLLQWKDATHVSKGKKVHRVKAQGNQAWASTSLLSVE